MSAWKLRDPRWLRGGLALSACVLAWAVGGTSGCSRELPNPSSDPGEQDPVDENEGRPGIVPGPDWIPAPSPSRAPPAR